MRGDARSVIRIAWNSYFHKFIRVLGIFAWGRDFFSARPGSQDEARGVQKRPKIQWVKFFGCFFGFFVCFGVVFLGTGRF